LFHREFNTKPSTFNEKNFEYLMTGSIEYLIFEIQKFVIEFLYSHIPECFSWKVFSKNKTILEYYFTNCKLFYDNDEETEFYEEKFEWNPDPRNALFMIKFTLEHFPNFFKENNLFSDCKKNEFKTIAECMLLVLKNS